MYFFSERLRGKVTLHADYQTFGRAPAALAVLGALGVIAGAFGAHAMRGTVPPAHYDAFEKGVFYHLTHVLAALSTLIGSGADMLDKNDALRIALIFCAGIVLFSGSLYLLAITGVTLFGAVTPIGGTLFILGWLLLARALRPGTER